MKEWKSGNINSIPVISHFSSSFMTWALLGWNPFRTSSGYRASWLRSSWPRNSNFSNRWITVPRIVLYAQIESQSESVKEERHFWYDHERYRSGWAKSQRNWRYYLLWLLTFPIQSWISNHTTSFVPLFGELSCQGFPSFSSRYWWSGFWIASEVLDHRREANTYENCASPLRVPTKSADRGLPSLIHKKLFSIWLAAAERNFNPDDLQDAESGEILEWRDIVTMKRCWSRVTWRRFETHSWGNHEKADGNRRK